MDSRTSNYTLALTKTLLSQLRAHYLDSDSLDAELKVIIISMHLRTGVNMD